jgi:hypothetical protein
MSKHSKLFVLFLGIVFIILTIVLVFIVVLMRFNQVNSIDVNNYELARPANRETKCIIGGCSRQLCVNADGSGEQVSTCEWREEYSCFRENFAKCEVQQNGQCGWTENSELYQCIREKSNIID